MAGKYFKKLFFKLLNSMPRPIKDRIFRSRLNIPPLSKNVIFQLAQSKEDLDQAFKILHDAYVAEGYSKSNESQRRVTVYHTLPSTTTLVAKLGDEVIATITVIRDGQFGLPADEVADLSVFRNRGQHMCEVSSLAIKPEYRGRSGELMFHLFSYMVYYSINYFAINRLIIVVNPKHISLYESILAFTRLSSSVKKSYEFVNGAPGICATLNLDKANKIWGNIYKGKPVRRNIHHLFFREFTPDEKRQMLLPDREYNTITDPVMNPELLDYFFNQCTDTLSQLEPSRLSILKSVYNKPAYDWIWPVDVSADFPGNRSDSRFDVDCKGFIDIQQKENADFRVLDASRSGLRIYSNIGLNPDDLKGISISIGKDKKVFVDVDIRWELGSIYGLKIINSDRLWNQFIDYLESQIDGMPRKNREGFLNNKQFLVLM